MKNNNMQSFTLKKTKNFCLFTNGFKNNHKTIKTH